VKTFVESHRRQANISGLFAVDRYIVTRSQRKKRIIGPMAEESAKTESLEHGRRVSENRIIGTMTEDSAKTESLEQW
jgi:hypothetical protein